MTLCHARVFCPQDKVHIPGAIYLSVKFDSRCYTEEGCDELIMSSSSDFVQDVHNFSGSPQKWSDFEIPGEDRLCVFAFEIMRLFTSYLHLWLSQVIRCTTDSCQT